MLMLAAAVVGPSMLARDGRRPIASAMEFHAGDDYGKASVGADVESGSLHRPQDASSATGIFFNADGERQVGYFHLKGSFDFRQSFENGIKYASTFDPLRDMPYTIADSTGGNWRKQYYSMWVDVSAKVCRNLSAGLGIDLDVGRGAKNIDPRPQAGMSRIGLKPSLSFDMGRGGVLSAGFAYFMYREHSNLILYDSSRPQKLYLLKGLGQYTYEIFSSTERERKYDGNSAGAKLGWHLVRDKFYAAAGASYLNGLETVFDVDYSKPHYRGKYYTDSWSGSMELLYSPGAYDLHVSADYSGSRGSGLEIVQFFDSSPDVNSWITDSEIPARYVSVAHDVEASAGVSLKQDGNVLWDFSACAGWNSIGRTYKATSSEMRVSLLDLGGAVTRNVRLEKARLSFTGSAGKSMALNSAFSCSGREPDDSNITCGLVETDFNILNASVFHVGLDAGCGWELKCSRSIGVSVSGLYKGAAGDLRRYGVTLSVSYLF